MIADLDSVALSKVGVGGGGRRMSLNDRFSWHDIRALRPDQIAEIEQEVRASFEAAARRRWDAAATTSRNRYQHRDDLAQWLFELLREDLAEGRRSLFLTFTAREVEHVGSLHRAMVVWCHRMERAVYGRGPGRIFAVLAAQRHLSGYWHGHGLVLRLPLAFRVRNFKRHAERAWPLGAVSLNALHGRTGLHLRLAKLQDAEYVTRYVIDETYKGGDDYGAIIYGRLDRDGECQPCPDWDYAPGMPKGKGKGRRPLTAFPWNREEMGARSPATGPARSRPLSPRRRMKLTLRDMGIAER